MNLTITTRSDASSKLHFEVPVSEPATDYEVKISIAPKAKTMSRDEWYAWVDEMAGSWEGDFVRPPQGDYETREPLS